MGYAAALALMLALVIMIVTLIQRYWFPEENLIKGYQVTVKRFQWVKEFYIHNLVLYAIITFLPFAWALSASFKRYQKLFQVEPILFPNRLHWKTTSKFSAKNHCLARWLFNSVFVAICVTGFNLLFNSMAGYALARIQFQEINCGFLILAVLMILDKSR